MDYLPGEVLLIDWADFGFALPGVPRRVSAFVAVLGHSRYLYLEFTLSQAMGSFLRAMDRALAFFGGCTHADVFDNMKTVVLERRPGLKPRFHPRFLAFANARGGFAIIACSPGYPKARAAWNAASRLSESDSGPAGVSPTCWISTYKQRTGATASAIIVSTISPARSPRSCSSTSSAPG